MTNIFATIATTMSDKLKTASTDVTSKLGEIETTFSTKLANMSTTVTNQAATWPTTMSDKLKTASTDVSSKLGEIETTASTKMAAVTKTITDESNKWSGQIKNAIKSVKDQFGNNFSWGIPTLQIPVKLPKFKQEGKWEFDDDGNITKTPKISVEWYRRAAIEGAIFDSPQIIGVGDASQPEMLIGEDTLYNSIRQAVIDAGGMGLNQTLNITAPQGFDAAEAARLVRNNSRQLLARMRGGV